MPTTNHERPSALTPSSPVPCLTNFQLYARFESMDPERNRARFYDLQWQPTLWGGGALIRVWGRLGSHGQTKVTFFPSREHTQGAVDRLMRERLVHGYHPTSWQ